MTSTLYPPCTANGALAQQIFTTSQSEYDLEQPEKVIEGGSSSLPGRQPPACGFLFPLIAD
jgi:hypothetical protein